jgi:dolichol-phosphate mannosyltransferase
VLCGIYLLSTLIGTLFFKGDPERGWTSLLLLGFMLGGANLVATAIVGEYVSRAYFQGKNRPIFIVAETARSSRTETAAR